MSKYQVTTDTEINPDEFNSRFGDIDNRLKDLEKAGSALKQAKDEIVDLGIARINPIVEEALELIENVSELSNIFEASSESSVEISLGVHEVIIKPDDRPNFAPTKFMAFYVNGMLDHWMSGQVQDWNKETGQLFINVTHSSGAGIFDAWVFTPTTIPESGPTTNAYTKTETDAAINQAKDDLLGGAGPAHDTLQELAAELADDENAVAGLTNLVSQKADLSDLTGNTVPIGAIIDFPVDAVPLGFLPCLGATFDELVYPELYTYLGANVLPDYTDRVRRGPGPLAGNVGDTQEDAFQGHEHEAGFSANTNPGRYGLGPDGQDGTYLDLDASNPGTFTAGGALTSTVGATETRVKSAIILPCIKAYSAFTSQGTADLAAMEQAINNAVLASGVQVFGDGGAQVRANIGVKDQAWELIQTVEVNSAVGSIDFSNLSEYRTLRLTIHAIGAVQEQIGLRFSEDNGVTFEAGTSDYVWSCNYASTGSESYTASTGESYIRIAAGSVGENSDEGMSLTLNLSEFNKSTRTRMYGFGAYLSGTNSFHCYNIGGIRYTEKPHDALRLFQINGNIAKGYFVLEGIKG